MSATPPATSDPPVRNVYIAGLPPSFDDAQLLDLICSRCCDRNALDSIKCVMDPRTRMCRGYGFVLFSDAQLAMHAVQVLDGLAVPAAPTATSNERVVHQLQVRPAHLTAQPTKHDITTRNAAHIVAQQGLRDTGSSARGTPTSLGGSQSTLMNAQSLVGNAAVAAGGGPPPPPSYQQACATSATPLLSPMNHSGSSVLSTSVYSPQLPQQQPMSYQPQPHALMHQQPSVFLTQVPPGASVFGMGSSQSNNASTSSIAQSPKEPTTSSSLLTPGQQQQQLNNSMSKLTVGATAPSPPTTTSNNAASNSNPGDNNSNNNNNNNNSNNTVGTSAGTGTVKANLPGPLNRSVGSTDDGLTLSALALDSTWNRSSMETNGTWNHSSSNNFASSQSQLASPHQARVVQSTSERQQLAGDTTRADTNNSPQPFLADSLFTSVAENPLFSAQTMASAPPTVGGKSTSALTSFPTTSNNANNTIHPQLGGGYQGLQFAPQQQHQQQQMHHAGGGGGGPLGLSFSTLAPPSSSFCTAVHPSPGCSLSNVFEQVSFLKANQQQPQQLFDQRLQQPQPQGPDSGSGVGGGHYHQNSASTVTTPSPSLQQQLMHVVSYEPSPQVVLQQQQQQDQQQQLQQQQLQQQQQHQPHTPGQQHTMGHMLQSHVVHPMAGHHHQQQPSHGAGTLQTYVSSTSHPFYGGMMPPSSPGGHTLMHAHQQHPGAVQPLVFVSPPHPSGLAAAHPQHQQQQQLQQGGNYHHQYPPPMQHHGVPMQYQVPNHHSMLHHHNPQQQQHPSGAGGYVMAPGGSPQQPQQQYYLPVPSSSAPPRFQQQQQH